MNQIERQFEPDRRPATHWLLSRKTFAAWTLASALAVWLALSVAEGLAAEQCRNDGRGWNWKTWSCSTFGGTIILPPGLRRAGSD